MKVWLLKNKQTKTGPLNHQSHYRSRLCITTRVKGIGCVKDNTVIKIGDDKILRRNYRQTKEAEMDIKINWKADEIEKGNSISSIIK
jgi:hypothetical protein